MDLFIRFNLINCEVKILFVLIIYSTRPNDGFFINDPENGAEDSNVALEKLRDVIAQCILPQAGKLKILSVSYTVYVCVCHCYTYGFLKASRYFGTVLSKEHFKNPSLHRNTNYLKLEKM